MVDRSCGFCGKPIQGRRAKRYCNPACAAGSRRAGEDGIQQWLAGTLAGHTGTTLKLKPWVREWVLKRAGYACDRCGWCERHPDDGRPLVEIDHIDGDAANSRLENLRVLCPNHHAMTSTFRRRNRVSRRQRSTPAIVLPDAAR